MLIGDNGLITKTIESKFKTEIIGIKEKVILYNTNQEAEKYTGISNINDNIKLETITLEESQKWKTSLKREILNWSGKLDVYGEITEKFAQNQWENYISVSNSNLEDLYYIVENGKNKNYIYYKTIDIVFKINSTSIGNRIVHSIEELSYLRGEASERRTNNYTTISMDSKLVTDLNYYEPDLNGFTKENTKLMYYSKVNNSFYEISVEDYLNQNRPQTITKNGTIYTLYDYANQIWANIKVEVASNVEVWLVWIPRYSYEINGTNTNITFISTDVVGTNGSIFDTNTKKGIWMSKYEPQIVTESDTTGYQYYMPDLTGFNKETTYIELVDKTTKTFKTPILYKDIGNLQTFARENYWFDYDNQVWANIMIENENIESWFVWIPRYAYKNTDFRTEIIFIDIDDKPMDGSTLPNNYEVAEVFRGNTKKGIWMSKYEPSEVEK